MSLTCPACYFPTSEVKDSRTVTEPMISVRRRRLCGNCKHRWTTYEINEDTMRKAKAAARAVVAIRRMEIEEIEFETTDAVDDE